MSTSERPLRIGISSCIFHEDRKRNVFAGKALYYLERSMADFVASSGALTYLVPPPSAAAGGRYASYADDFDALVLTGGVDVAPTSYGQTADRPEWAGDAVRDAYELALLRATLERDKPVLVVCRGHQLLNVAFGGTLYQDISTYVERARVHRDAALYEGNEHQVELFEGEQLAAIFGATHGLINSVHHQAIRDLGAGLTAEARSVEDGLIEAVVSKQHRWVRGVQWHPEFRFRDPALLDQSRLLASFLDAAAQRKNPT